MIEEYENRIFTLIPPIRSKTVNRTNKIIEIHNTIPAMLFLINIHFFENMYPKNIQHGYIVVIPILNESLKSILKSFKTGHIIRNTIYTAIITAYLFSLPWMSLNAISEEGYKYQSKHIYTKNVPMNPQSILYKRPLKFERLLSDEHQKLFPTK